MVILSQSSFNYVLETNFVTFGGKFGNNIIMCENRKKFRKIVIVNIYVSMQLHASTNQLAIFHRNKYSLTSNIDGTYSLFI